MIFLTVLEFCGHYTCKNEIVVHRKNFPGGFPVDFRDFQELKNEDTVQYETGLGCNNIGSPVCLNFST